MQRKKIIRQICDIIQNKALPHPTRVGIDGPSAAGKTVLADEIAAILRENGHHVIRATIDGFHHPRAIRTRRGDYCPHGYYQDSFDFDAVRQWLLKPLGMAGDLNYRTAVFDFRNENDVESETLSAPPDAILIFDGVFLHRPEIADCWDVSVYIDCGFDEVLKRALKRDAARLGSSAQVEKKYNRRYIPGQRFYLESIRPQRQADIVIDNRDFERPRIIEEWVEEISARDVDDG